MSDDIEKRVFRAAELSKMGRYELMQIILDLDADLDKANKKWEDLSAYIIGDNELYDDLDYDLIIEKMKDLEDKEHYKNT